MFKKGMIVKTKRNVQFACKGEQAEVFQDNWDDEVTLCFGGHRYGAYEIPECYFDFNDFEVVKEQQ